MENNKSKISKQKFIGFSLLLLTLSMGILPSLMAPVPGVFAVELSNDSTVKNASRTLSQNIQGLTVVEYDSFKYLSLVWRALEPVIWISHSNEEGVQIQGKMSDWSALEPLVYRTPNKDIMLSCYSSNLIEETELTSADVFTFNNEIDSTLGALFISYALTGNEKIVEKIIDRAFTLTFNPEMILPLRMVEDGPPPSTPPPTYTPGLSQVELGYWIIMVVIFFIGAIVGWYMDPNWSFVQKLGIKLIAVGKIGILTTLAYVGAGYMTWDAAIPKIVGFCFDTLGYLLKALQALTLAEQLLYGLSLILSVIAQIGVYIFSASTLLWLKIAAIAASGIALCVGIAHDFFDKNDWIG